jgi:hypothetical protein
MLGRTLGNKLRCWLSSPHKVDRDRAR